MLVAPENLKENLGWLPPTGGPNGETVLPSGYVKIAIENGH